MKKLSIKTRLMVTTMGILLIMVSVLLILFGVITNISADHTKQDTLKRVVNHNADEIESTNGNIHISNRFSIFKNDIHCVVMTNEQEIIEGIVPVHDLLSFPFENGTVRHIRFNRNWYYIYDIEITFPDSPSVWIRGTSPASNNTINVSKLTTLSLFIIPALIILSALAAYFIISNSLKPINQITQAAIDVSDSGDLSRRISFTSDDELGKLADVFNQMFHQLEEDFMAERQFTSDASHELRTPVSVILAQCEYAFEHASNEIELYECIGVIQKQGIQMSHMIEALLSFTRLEQRMVTIHLNKTNISRLTETICQEQAIIPEKQITLIWDIEPEIFIDADERLYSVMLSNLIRNAYRYGKPYGHIKVSLKIVDNRAILAVEDDGIGISKEDLPKIWNRFYRADKARSAKEHGLGLGLPLVKKAAELHGGTVEVESILEKGSIFKISLILF